MKNVEIDYMNEHQTSNTMMIKLLYYHIKEQLHYLPLYLGHHGYSIVTAIRQRIGEKHHGI